MSSNVGRYTPVAGNPQNVDTGMPWEYIRVINSSPYALSLSLGGQGTIDFPEMYLEDIKIAQSYNGKLNFTPFSNIPNPAAALTNYVSINVYPPGEIRQPQAQPLTTMSNVGNSVPLSATATAIANDGTTVATEFLEASISGVKKVSIFTDGTSHLPLAVAQTTGAGVSAYKIISTDGQGEIDLQQLVTGTFRVQDDAPSTLMELFRGAGGMRLSGLGNKIKAWSFFSGTGTGTFNHNLGTTPNVVLAMQSSVGSQTMGWDTPTATQVHITAAGGNAWVAVALLMA